MRRERLGREEREKRIRIFVEGYTAGCKQLPTVAEVVKAVGGSTATVAPVLQEFRAPHATRKEERCPTMEQEATGHFDMEEYKRRMEEALRIAKQLDPIIRAGTLSEVDVARDIREMRAERARQVSGARR